LRSPCAGWSRLGSEALAAVDRRPSSILRGRRLEWPRRAVVGSATPSPLGAELALSALADPGLVVLEDGESRSSPRLIREGAYGTLTKAERARRHAGLGGWLADRRRGDDDEPVDPIALSLRHRGGARERARSVEGVPADLRGPRAVDALEHAAERAEEVEASATRPAPL